MNYNWECQACENTVAAGNESCTTCGCPASCSGREIDSYKEKYMNSDAVRNKSKFRCAKCDYHLSNTGAFRAAGGSLSAAFDLATESFNYVSCNKCGYTEFYKSRVSGAAFVADVLLGS
jgi:predicted nucleic-acid-binding Zn-ribbon protein